MSDPRPPRPLAARPLPSRPLPPRPLAVRPSPEPTRPPAHRSGPGRPDSRPMRTLLGLTGLAAMSAIATAIVSPPVTGDAAVTTSVQTQSLPTAPVQHITRYVQLQPGQTAPPSSVVKAAPAPTPRIVVVTTTRQSGRP